MRADRQARNKSGWTTPESTTGPPCQRRNSSLTPHTPLEKRYKKYKLQAYVLTRYEVQAVHGVGVGLEHVVVDSLDEELVHLLRGGGDEAPEDVGKAVKDVTRSHQGVL